MVTRRDFHKTTSALIFVTLLPDTAQAQSVGGANAHIIDSEEKRRSSNQTQFSGFAPFVLSPMDIILISNAISPGSSGETDYWVGQGLTAYAAIKEIELGIGLAATPTGIGQVAGAILIIDGTWRLVGTAADSLNYTFNGGTRVEQTMFSVVGATTYTAFVSTGFSTQQSKAAADMAKFTGELLLSTYGTLRTLSGNKSSFDNIFALYRWHRKYSQVDDVFQKSKVFQGPLFQDKFLYSTNTEAVPFDFESSSLPETTKRPAGGYGYNDSAFSNYAPSGGYSSIPHFSGGPIYTGTDINGVGGVNSGGGGGGGSGMSLSPTMLA